jgi:hypothetical protein
MEGRYLQGSECHLARLISVIKDLRDRLTLDAGLNDIIHQNMTVYTEYSQYFS